MMVRVIQNRPFSEKFKGFVWSPEFGATIITVLVLVALPVTFLVLSKPQDVRQQAETVNPTAEMTISPSSGSYVQGEQFSVNLMINGGGQNFNQAKADVSVSTNLSIQSLYLTPPESNGCNFTFVDVTSSPTYQNPSFNGVLTAGSSSTCTLYTMVLKANGPGTAFINVVNAQVKLFSNGDEIFKSSQNGIYTIR